MGVLKEAEFFIPGFTGCLAGCIISDEGEAAQMHHRFGDPGCKRGFLYGDIPCHAEICPISTDFG